MRFDKYRTRGADYHYRQIDRKSFKNFSAPVEARFETLVDQITKAAEDKKLKLLDVGSGDGVALYLLSKRLPDAELYGIDPALEALEVARKSISRANFTQGEAHELPFENDFFDIVISSDVIEHVESPAKMLEEIKRVAKDDATIVIGTPVKHSKYPFDPNHVEEFFAEDFRDMMEKYFRKVELHESHGLALTLLYNAPTRFKYLVNLLAVVTGYNPFKAERKNKLQMFAYMYVVCRK